MFHCSMSPILKEIESQFFLMEYSPRNSLQIVLEFSDMIELTMYMRKKYKITTCASVNATGGTVNINEPNL